MNRYTRAFRLTLIITLAIFAKTYGQGYRIETTLKGIKDTTLIFGHFSHSHGQFVPKDTARADANGLMVFEGKTEIPGGLYVILFPGNQRWVQVVYSGKETNFSVATDTADVIGTMKVKNSPENELFYSYQKELRNTSEEIEVLNKQSGADHAAKVKVLQEKFKNYRQKLLKDNADTFTAQLLKMSVDPEIPVAPKLANGKTDSVWVFNYYKAHFWDNMDLSDGRILNTPFVEPKLDRYIKTLVVQTPDSLIKDADWIIGKASANKEVKTFFTYYLANQYENPKTVGTEALWVHLANKYYLSGDMGISEDSKKRIADKVGTLKYLLVDKVFPALVLSDQNGKKISVQQIQASYTVLFFYSPTCGHCKEAAPLLKAFYDKNKASGVKVMAISIDHNLEEWKAFIPKYHLDELLNGFDALKEIDFNRKFDVVTTPTIYVLDKNKRIIARKMPVDQLEDFLNYYQRRQAKKL